MKSKHLAALILVACFVSLGFCACQNGRYIGPSIGISGGYEGATVGLTLFGENPVTKDKSGLTNSPVQLTSGTAATIAAQ